LPAGAPATAARATAAALAGAMVRRRARRPRSVHGDGQPHSFLLLLLRTKLGQENGFVRHYLIQRVDRPGRRCRPRAAVTIFSRGSICAFLTFPCDSEVRGPMRKTHVSWISTVRIAYCLIPQRVPVAVGALLKVAACPRASCVWQATANVEVTTQVSASYDVPRRRRCYLPNCRRTTPHSARSPRD
jgi:hypothetical protein